MGKLDGRVAVITGAGRGQGRSHAVTLAAAGADIIAIDLCADIATNEYGLATEDDLDETRRLVEKEDRRCLTAIADVREPGQLRTAIREGVDELGGLHIVVANAGICPLGDVARTAFLDAVDVDLVGVINTVSAAFPYLSSGASIIATGSAAALMKGSGIDVLGPGGFGYGHSKRAVAQYVHDLALTLAPESIRVNCIHPTNCNTDMLHSGPMYKTFRPDLETPTRDDVVDAFATVQPMPVPWVEPEQVSKAVLFLASDDAEFVTGMQMKIDAGTALAHTNPYSLR
ncbi:mycofactocin-coupled SDR family oxidoreductase [Gordonia hankookensis]|uniref:Mycofactocin-coupled SDR family oxidoreductase n=1 Tax=Gordonia hankookensis TaxID=589403 RepID=A0ABR7WAL2_9ACTN|nr:mycofactocin-coupled SDR family oxidoreductase [Gordonia hankookensis]MBD1319591.1 mycofactocin-coupled SDR family oxidoreductase [Gordonia hankookensis]NDZ95988.1 mycofactocin-coupled SDR family oxidoreductase [Streptomyces sp. SID11726]NEB23799.1 mycofactocin-coupled SDR family oxidoreductase [Streptomyces sp. SID6673]